MGTKSLLGLLGRSLPFADKGVLTQTEFGPLSSRITQYDELCLPATILP